MSGGPLDFPDEPAAEPRPAGRADDPRGAGASGSGSGPAPTAGAPSRLSRLRPSGSTRYGWLAALLVLVAIVWISLSTMHSEGGGATGLAPGTKLPPFATPLAGSDSDAVANVATRPNQGQAGKHPACTVRGPQILNSCQLAERGPVVLAFVITRGDDCVAALDRLQAAVADVAGVQLAAVAWRSDRTDVRRLIADHHWTFPIGMDPDNVVTNIYGAVVCPQVTYAYPGGEVRGTTIGLESEATIRARLARLVAVSRKRGWTPS